METPLRRFMVKKTTGLRVPWLNRKTVYEGKLLSLTRRTVRLFSPTPGEGPAHVDLSYDWLVPMH